MKTKRFLSVLLALALCLGMLPGATLATESSLPEDYEQMYYQFVTGRYGADIEVNINSRTTLAGNLFADSNGSTALDVTKFEFSFSVENLGAIVDNNYCWDTNNSAVAGTSGYLYAISDTQKYAIPVAIRTDDSSSGGNTGELPALPEGYDQMYVGSDYDTTASNPAGNGRDIYLFAKTDEVPTLLNSDAGYTISCDNSVGAVGAGKDGAINWRAGDALPGASGYIYADSDNAHYAVYVTIGDPMVGVYTDAALTKYLKTSERTFSYTVEGEENPVVYVAAGDENATITAISDDSNGNLSYTLPEGGARSVAVTPSDSASGDFSTEVSVTLSNGKEPSVRLTFEDATPETGVYTTLNNDQLSGFIEMIQLDNGSGPWGYEVSYTSGESITVYYYNAAETHTCDSKDITYAAVESMTGLYSITLPEGMSGEVSVNLLYGDSGFPIVFTDGTSGGNGSDSELEIGVYTALTDGQLSGFIAASKVYGDEGPTGYKVTYTSGESITIYYYNPDQACSCEGYNDVTFASVNGMSGVYSLTLKNGKSGTVETVISWTNTDGGSSSFPIVFTDGTGSSSGNDPYLRETLISETRPIEDGDKLSVEETEDIGGKNGPAAFQYDVNGDGKPETYYLCTMTPMYADQVEFSMAYASGTSQMYEEGAEFMTSYCIGIWTYNADANYYSLVDGDTKTALLGAFGDTWTAKAYHDYHDSEPEYPATAYPAVYSWTPADGWPCGVTFIHYEDCIGDWDYAFTGKINGKTITAYAHAGFNFYYEKMEATVASVAEANATLQYWAEIKDPDDSAFMGDTTYTLYLLSGEYTGVINVPEKIGVDIYGSTTGERTVLTGGVGGPGRARVSNIDFIGYGWQHTNWPDNDIFNGEPNYGLSTAKGGRYNDCSFKNYYHALHCGFNQKHAPNMIFGGDRTRFENNFIALYLNSNQNGGGNLTMYANTFRHNGCALWLESMGNDFPLNHYHLIQCKFYDNGWDVINLLGLCYFIPGQLFERDGKYGHGKFTSDRNAITHGGTSPRSVENYASSAVTDVSEVGSGVYTFPVAVDDKFEEFDYTTSNAVIANFNAASWLIPENDLNGKTITVIQDDKGKDITIWTFEEENT